LSESQAKSGRLTSSWSGYWHKWRGRGHGAPPRVSLSEILWSLLGSTLGIGVVIVCAQWLDGADRLLVIGSLGASAVLLFGAPRSPLAQPRNLIGGHFVSALVGVSTHLALIDRPELAAALAVGVAIAVMHLTRTLHPPGGATALVAVIGSDRLHAMGYWYAFFPGLLAPLLLLLMALLVNNLAPRRSYPEFWW